MYPLKKCDIISNVNKSSFNAADSLSKSVSFITFSTFGGFIIPCFAQIAHIHAFSIDKNCSEVANNCSWCWLWSRLWSWGWLRLCRLRCWLRLWSWSRFWSWCWLRLWSWNWSGLWSRLSLIWARFTTCSL
jgi:hypothetical protein